MNAEKKTQVRTTSDNVRELIDICQRQNELIFATRKRLFKLEHNFRLSIAGVSITLITTGLMGLVVSYG